MNQEEKEFLTVKEFADLISVHPNSVRNMIKNGRLAAFKVGGGKLSSYRIARSETHKMALLNWEKIISDMVEKKLKEK